MLLTTKQKIIAQFKTYGGILATHQALCLGIHPRCLGELVKEEVLVKLARGLYRLVDLPPLSNPDLVTVASKIPRAVIFLVSALYFYNLTSEIPHEVYIALPQGSEEPRITFPPFRLFRVSPRIYEMEIETHWIDKVPIRVYSKEKTIADCFRYRNKIGLEVATEALKNYLNSKGRNLNKLYKVACDTRAGKIIEPYLTALT